MVKADISVNDMVLNYINDLKIEIDVEKVILFGSRAKGEELEDSDIDLVVISEDFSKMSFIERLEFLELKWKYTLSLEALGYTLEEYNELSKGLGIVSEINKYGIVICE